MTAAPARGTFCISIDLELAWGYWDRLTPDTLKNCRDLERPIIARMLGLFDRYNVSATWAVVGSLLKKSSGGPALPGDESVWYAPDIIEKITAARTPQDIGSHSFAHIYFSECDADAANADLADAKRIHAENGLPFTSFVFPRNQIGHLDALARAGIRVFRSTECGWAQDVKKMNRMAGRAANLLDKILPVSPETVSAASGRDGMVEIPSSMQILRRNGLRRLISNGSLEAKAFAGLRSAAEKNEVFHAWFHPDTFYFQTDDQFRVLEHILSRASDMRRRGELRISPMADFAGGV